MRYLNQRDKAWEDGDKLAQAVKNYLNGSADEAELCHALMSYHSSQGFNGSACNMVRDVIDYEREMNND